MKTTFLSTIMIAGLLLGCSESGNTSSSTDGGTSTDATTTTDAADATDSGDATDGSDTSDNSDSTDATDGSDVSLTCDQEGPCCVVDTITCDSPITTTNAGGAKKLGKYPCDEFNIDYSEFSEVVFKFSPTVDTKITPTITSSLLFDLFVIPEVDEACSLAGCSLTPTNSSEVTEVPAGTTLYFSVEHWQGDEAEFTLDLGCCTPNCDGKTCGDDGCGSSCGTCGDGETCSAEGVCQANNCSPVRALTCGESFTVDTAGPDSTNTTLENGCIEAEGFYSGPEVAYSFASDVLVEVTVDAPEVGGVEDDGVDIFAIKDQGDGVCDMGFCEAAGYDTTIFFSAPGDTHYVVFDGYEGTSQVLDVGVTCCYAECDGKVCGDDGCGNTCADCPALEACAADQSACLAGQYADNSTCETAETITSLPFITIGSTTDATANYSTQNAAGDGGEPGCVGVPSGGKDVVYSYTPTVTGTLEVWLEQVLDDESVCADPLNDSGCVPKTLHVVTTCPDAADFAGCVGGIDYLAGSTPFPTRLPVEVTADTTYFIIVSGYNENEYGTYKLLVDWVEDSGLDGTDATDGTDVVEGTDVTDGTDTTDGVDTTDGTDAMDSGTTVGTDATDDPMMDGIDTTDGTDAMDGTDVMDGMGTTGSDTGSDSTDTGSDSTDTGGDSTDGMGTTGSGTGTDTTDTGSDSTDGMSTDGTDSGTSGG